MRLSIEVETARHEDARLIARALARLLELEARGSGARITVTAGRRTRVVTGRAFTLAAEVAAAQALLGADAGADLEQ